MSLYTGKRLKKTIFTLYSFHLSSTWYQSQVHKPRNQGETILNLHLPYVVNIDNPCALSPLCCLSSLHHNASPSLRCCKSGSQTHCESNRQPLFLLYYWYHKKIKGTKPPTYFHHCRECRTSNNTIMATTIPHRH